MRPFLFVVCCSLCAVLSGESRADDASTNIDSASDFVKEAVQLNYAGAVHVAGVLRSIRLHSPSARVVADERSNRLLLCGSEQDVRVLKEAIGKMDVVVPQVLVEGLVFEVTLSDAPGASGLSWFRDWMDARKGKGGGVVGQVARFVPVNETNAPMSSSKSFSEAFTLSEDFNSLLQDLAKDERVRILERPRVQASIGEPVSMFVGKSRYPAGNMEAYSCGSPIQRLEGLTVEVTIRQTQDTSLEAEIYEGGEQSNRGVHIANVGEVPVTKRTGSQAALSIQNQKTFMVGGMSLSAAKRGKREHFLLMLRPILLPADPVAARKP